MCRRTFDPRRGTMSGPAQPKGNAGSGNHRSRNHIVACVQWRLCFRRPVSGHPGRGQRNLQGGALLRQPLGRIANKHHFAAPRTLVSVVTPRRRFAIQFLSLEDELAMAAPPTDFGRTHEGNPKPSRLCMSRSSPQGQAHIGGYVESGRGWNEGTTCQRWRCQNRRFTSSGASVFASACPGVAA